MTFAVNPERCQPNGFSMTFPNKWRVSVQWGEGNYCDHRWNNEARHNRMSSGHAEIAIFEPGTDKAEVKGWLTAESVAEILHEVSQR